MAEDYDPFKPSGDFGPDDPLQDLALLETMGLPTGFDTSKVRSF